MGKIDVICFGGEDWWYHNRGHIDMQLMRRFAKRGTALYINSIVMQKLGLGQGRKFLGRLIRKSRSIFKGLKKSEAGFWVYSPVSFPLHHITWCRRLNTTLLQFQINRVIKKLSIYDPIILVGCPTAYDIVFNMKKRKLVYQRTDRYEEYPNVNGDVIKMYDRRLKEEADLTLFVNISLYDEEKSHCKQAIYLDHAVDYEMFTSAEHNPCIPPDIASIQKPIVGYFGALDDHKLDIIFLETVVSLLPHISFVFVGKVSVDCSSLAAKKNVWMLGQKDYEQIPYYGKCFDVVIIPWHRNRWTEAANPIKFKEYLALGKPIVSTPAFTELRRYLDVVYQAETAEEFVLCIKKALVEDSVNKITARREKVKNNSWDCKAQLILDELFPKNKFVKDEKFVV